MHLMGHRTLNPEQPLTLHVRTRNIAHVYERVLVGIHYAHLCSNEFGYTLTALDSGNVRKIQFGVDNI